MEYIEMPDWEYIAESYSHPVIGNKSFTVQECTRLQASFQYCIEIRLSGNLEQKYTLEENFDKMNKVLSEMWRLMSTSKAYEDVTLSTYDIEDIPELQFRYYPGLDKKYKPDITTN